jgi:hypothetical protein
MIWILPRTALTFFTKNLTATESGAILLHSHGNLLPIRSPGYRYLHNGTLLGVQKYYLKSGFMLTPGLHYQFTVKAYDQDYLESEDHQQR